MPIKTVQSIVILIVQATTMMMIWAIQITLVMSQVPMETEMSNQTVRIEDLLGMGLVVLGLVHTRANHQLEKWWQCLIRILLGNRMVKRKMKNSRMISLKRSSLLLVSQRSLIIVQKWSRNQIKRSLNRMQITSRRRCIRWVKPFNLWILL